MKTTLRFMTVLLALTLLAGACAPAATPAPAPAASSAAPSAPSAPAPTAPAPARPTATVQPAPSAPAPAPAAEKPKPGGTLNLVHFSDPPDLDIMWNAGIATSYLTNPSYNGLVQFNPAKNDEIVARLAESWTVSPDGKTYTFKLRKGVKFHDGTPFTADDVVATLTLWTNPPTGRLWLGRQLAQSIDSVKAMDANTAEVRLKRPSSSFISVLAHGSLGAILPKSVLDKQKGVMGNIVMGTGPYKFKSYVRGSTYEAVKNADYFMPGMPYLDGLRFFLIRDHSTMFAAFRTKKAQVSHIFETLTPSEISQVKDNKDVVIVSSLNLINRMVAFNHSKKPWDDVRVRRAVSLAFDRYKAVATLGEGVGQIGTALPPGPSVFSEKDLLLMPGYRKDKTADIAEAKKLLAEAGYASGITTTMLSRSGWPAFEDMAVYTAQQLSQIGIKVAIDSRESALYLRARATGDFEMSALAAGALFPDPMGMLFYYGPKNDYRYESAKRDDAVLRYDTAVDPTAREKAAKDLDKALMDEVPYIIAFWEVANVAHWKEVKGVVPWNGQWNNNTWEQVWLAQ